MYFCCIAFYVHSAYCISMRWVFWIKKYLKTFATYTPLSHLYFNEQKLWCRNLLIYFHELPYFYISFDLILWSGERNRLAHILCIVCSVQCTYICWKNASKYSVKKLVNVKSAKSYMRNGFIINDLYFVHLLSFSACPKMYVWTVKPGLGVLDEPYSAKPAQRSIHTGPPGKIGWTRFQPRVCRQYGNSAERA